MGSMSPYGETLRCERCFSPYKIVGAVEAPRKRLLCNECGHSEDVYVIASTSPATRWTLIEPSGEVRVYASQDDLLDALRSAPHADAEPETPRGSLELVESESDLAARFGDEEPKTREIETPHRQDLREAETQDPPPVVAREHGEAPHHDDDHEREEYVSLKDVVVAPVAESVPEQSIPRKSLPPPLPPESTSHVVDPPLALAEHAPVSADGETLPSEDLLSDPAPVVLEADLAPPSVRALSVPPPLPAKRITERPKSMPPPLPAKKEEPEKEKKAEPARSLPPKPKRPDPAQSAPEIIVDERPRVAKQVPQAEQQQSRSLFVPAIVVLLLLGGGWYWYTQGPSTAQPTTSHTSDVPQPSAATPTTSATATVHEQPSASSEPVFEIASTPVQAPATTGPRTDMRSMPELLTAAGAARAKGNNAQAKELYGKVLGMSPANVEANAGLGSVARSEGDLATARASYEKALAGSPSYYPALLGLADTEWELGDRASAQLHYKRLLDMPQAAPDRVRERAGVVAPKPAPSPTEALTSAPAPQNQP
ncbi:MAG TPA: tetratricopeptide repeat protein [Labilithrix sp.]